MIMKRAVFLFGIIALFVGLSSCESLYEDGEWQKMELDKSGLYFNSFGGEEVVRVLNYESWRIAGGYEATEYIDGNLIYKNYVYPQSTDGESGNTYDLLDGGWYRVTVPHKGECRKAVITVDQNLLTYPRQATVQMQSGNSFTNIIIYQP